MSGFVDRFAPRSWLDFVVKTVLLMLVIGGLNWARDSVDLSDTPDGYWKNLRDATVVGLPFVMGGLLMIMHLARLQRALADAVVRDHLTGLLNRRGFFERAPAELRRRGGALLILDIDHFKRINDTFGHAAGDRCLEEIASRLRAAARGTDLVARLGGEEFAMLLVGAPLGHGKTVGQTLAKGLEFTPPDAEPQRVTLSVGITNANDGEDLDGILRRADKAMYEAKGAGRARAICRAGPGPRGMSAAA